jgi:hypothetical protein
MKERSHPSLYFHLLVTVSINSDLLGNMDLCFSFCRGKFFGRMS